MSRVSNLQTSHVSSFQDGQLPVWSEHKRVDTRSWNGDGCPTVVGETRKYSDYFSFIFEVISAQKSVWCDILTIFSCTGFR